MLSGLADQRFAVAFRHPVPGFDLDPGVDFRLKDRELLWITAVGPGHDHLCVHRSDLFQKPEPPAGPRMHTSCRGNIAPRCGAVARPRSSPDARDMPGKWPIAIVPPLTCGAERGEARGSENFPQLNRIHLVNAQNCLRHHLLTSWLRADAHDVRFYPDSRHRNDAGRRGQALRLRCIL